MESYVVCPRLMWPDFRISTLFSTFCKSSHSVYPSAADPRLFCFVQTLPGGHRRCACSNSEGIQEHSKVRIWWFHQLCVTIGPYKVSTNALLDSQRLDGWLRIRSELHRPFVDHQSAIHHWLFSEPHPQLMLDLFFVDGFDASVHISEEASNASFAVPWALMMAVIVSSILGWGMYGFLQRYQGPLHFGGLLGINVVLAFNMGTDMESILTSPIGQPMATVRSNPHLISINMLTSTILPDPVQQLWSKRYLGCLGCSSRHTVCGPRLLVGYTSLTSTFL